MRDAMASSCGLRPALVSSAMAAMLVGAWSLLVPGVRVSASAVLAIASVAVSCGPAARRVFNNANGDELRGATEPDDPRGPCAARATPVDGATVAPEAAAVRASPPCSPL
jgi:hypothetical protein